MFKIGDKVVYKRNVCTIKNIELNKFSNKECYILIPIDDESLNDEKTIIGYDEEGAKKIIVYPEAEEE